ncbi:PucR family transcriptional regulator [Pelosinus sp. UFO1]|uniref:PucR family transcriptional regulator n=1 Tax=Pelosinus sp. UFO1 TaxID=484770 RepID=UPI0004D14379|nr:PucR family transcriptional regulator [Pelosinus sp. UFO1]AIF49830.1 transcriptional regulator, PucR family [Pelosinus sp. UFO1]
MISIAELLKNPPFSQMTVLNRAADLSRKVDSADISETPDITFFIKPHTLLITTGMAFKEDSAGFCRMIEELNCLPIAGICVKLGRFIDELDPSILETADKLHFPLLQIPASWTLGITCHQLLSYLWNVENQQLLNALKIQREYSQMLIKDTPISALLAHLSRTVRQVVFLTDPFWEIIDTSLPMGKETMGMNQTIAAIKESGKFRNSPSESVPSSLYVQASRPFTAWIFPVWPASVHPHLLIVLEEEKIPYPFSYLVIEQTAAATAFSLYKNQKLKELHRRIREDFLRRLTHSTSNTDTTAFLEQGADLGLVSSDYYRFLIVGIDGLLEENNPVRSDLYSLVYDWMERHVAIFGENAILFSCQKSETIMILLQNPVENLESSLAFIREQMTAFLSVSISCAAGNPVTSLHSLPFSRIEAEEIYHQCRVEGRKAFFRTYYSQGVSELLRFVPQEHAHHFCTCILKSLAYPEQEAQVILRQTLQTYLDCQGDIAETARVLYIHRNTVKYRIARLNDLLDTPLSNPDFSLQLRLALLISKL